MAGVGFELKKLFRSRGGYVETNDARVFANHKKKEKKQPPEDGGKGEDLDP